MSSGRPSGLAALASAAAAAVALTGCGQGKTTTVISGAHAATPTTPAPTATSTATTTKPPATRTVDGALVGTRYGDVQVAVTFSKGHLTDVEPVTLPSDRPRSQFISQQAGPLLRQESLQAKSGSIHIISGATYTSEAWAQSLSAALAAS